MPLAHFVEKKWCFTSETPNAGKTGRPEIWIE